MAFWRLWPHGGGNGYRAVAALLVAPADPAMARRANPDIWGDLFGVDRQSRARPRTLWRSRCRGRARPRRRLQSRRRRRPRSQAARTPPRTRPRTADRSRPTAEPPPPSACRLALTDAIAIAPSIPDIRGPGGCGGEDLVRLEAIVLPDKRQVAGQAGRDPPLQDGDRDRRLDPDRHRTAGGEDSAARSPISTISTRTNAAAATMSPARYCRSTAAPMRSTCAASSSPMAARFR